MHARRRTVGLDVRPVHALGARGRRAPGDLSTRSQISMGKLGYLSDVRDCHTSSALRACVCKGCSMGERLIKSSLRLDHVNGDVIERVVSSILEWGLVVAIGERNEQDA